MPQPPTVAWVLRQLRREYGPPPSRPQLNPVAELVLTILSQNTSDVNSHRAYTSLTSRFPTWEAVTDADEEQVAQAIRAGGLENIKAPRIQAVLREILRLKGRLDLGFLTQMPLQEAKAWLQSMSGVGPKTAACVLLFSLHMPALPVDTHVLRVSSRLGLVERKATAEKAQRVLEPLVPPHEVYPFHIYLIMHGRRICRARKPLWQACVLKERCPSAFAPV